MRALATAVALVLAATAVAGCGNDVDDAGSSWPRRDVRLLAPADPGGGWDTTAREMARVLERGEVIDVGVEVYNVPGAGGTIGLAQLASKRTGRSDQIMVMGRRDARCHPDQPGAGGPRGDDADRRHHDRA